MRRLPAGLFLLICTLVVGSYLLARDAEERYQTLLSAVVYDRHHTPLSIAPNSKGLYVYEIATLPEDFTTMLLQKEDRFFYFHPGVNPASILRALWHTTFGSGIPGSSTLTQQLTKNILHTESDRTIRNKSRELLYALSVELFWSKKTILERYANTVFLGSQIQGFETGSYAYFKKPLAETTPNERLSLLATLSHPSTRNPWKNANAAYAEALHAQFSRTDTFVAPKVSDSYALQSPTYFELESLGVTCAESCVTSVDGALTEAMRDILKRHIRQGYERGMRNGAIAIIDPRRSDLIALVGSADPYTSSDGQQINMALEPRPVGSTIKPFIYVKGFMEGLRPYTFVEDREYKYPIATGYSLYPKNYDGEYRDRVTLHEALSNSLNVPTVKVLEYIGLSPFYAFLGDTLHFKPIQPFDSYQYGIALGGLEMDLLTLTHYYTLFPRMGTLAPLRAYQDRETPTSILPQATLTTEEHVVPPEYVELINAVLSDRLAGVNQFGLRSSLNLTASNYAVKTGTSRDYHDSWVVGYTPNIVVGVWVGNSENQALAQVSGVVGAGAVWHDVMEYLLATPYTDNTPFTRTRIVPHPIGYSEEWGLPFDDITTTQNLLLEDTLILSVHQGDTFAFSPTLTIPLKARSDVTWSINGKEHARTQQSLFTPERPGTYEIAAFDQKSNRREIVIIDVTLTQ